jgi:hypothetical protein
VGHGQDFFYSIQGTAMSSKNVFLQNIIHSCRVNLHFPTLCMWLIDRPSVIHSWHLNAMSGPDTKVNKIFFWNNCRFVVFEKLDFLTENRGNYFKQ